jgi:eukaryotic translation initiation factor 2C
LQFGLASVDLAGLHHGLSQAQRSHGPDESKVVFLLLAKRCIQTYQAFKSLADRDFGLHYICITEAANIESVKKKFHHGFEVADAPWITYEVGQYFGNIMMKVNLKMGSINHSTALVRTRMLNTLVLEGTRPTL